VAKFVGKLKREQCPARAPVLPLAALDTVWIQLTCTLCNIACRLCFFTCGPKETRVPMMAGADVSAALDDAARLGAREYYFTGGEPMLHPEFWALCEAALAHGPLTVLSNGILVDEDAAARARALFDAARYSFDLRVSLDGMTADENDAVRGRGTFAEITAGIARLAAVGLSPTLTVVEHDAGMGAEAARARFLALCLRPPSLRNSLRRPVVSMTRSDMARSRAGTAGRPHCDAVAPQARGLTTGTRRPGSGRGGWSGVRS
jgi:sulfatase maturation enzyme AslB (radical SAM superfamily)